MLQKKIALFFAIGAYPKENEMLSLNKKNQIVGSNYHLRSTGPIKACGKKLQLKFLVKEDVLLLLVALIVSQFCGDRHS